MTGYIIQNISYDTEYIIQNRIKENKMIDQIIHILEENPQVAAWKIIESSCHSCELYYVGHKLETNRNTDTISWNVTVFKDQDNKRGLASFQAYPYMTEKMLKEEISRALYAASFAMNPYFELPMPEGKQPLVFTDVTVPTTVAPVATASTTAPSAATVATTANPAAIALTAIAPAPTANSGFPNGRSFNELIEELADAVFSEDHLKDGSLNATEFFIYHEYERICNSNGIDVSREHTHGAIEIIPSWTSENVEAEVIHMIRFSDYNPQAIAAEVHEQLLFAKARCEAKPLSEVMNEEIIEKTEQASEGKAKLVAGSETNTQGSAKKSCPKIILQGQEVKDVLNYFSSDLSYALKYRHANRHELGECVQGKEITGTRLNVKRIPYYPGAVASRPFDSDGVLLKDTELIHDGIAVSRFGEYSMGYYLGEKSPVGHLPVLEVTPGEKTYAEMTKEPYIRCVKFSGIQVDPFSDYFGGEVRLGFYFDGEKEIPVTGFAISGNMSKEKGSMNYSAETQTLADFHGPKYLEIFGMTAI